MYNRLLMSEYLPHEGYRYGPWREDFDFRNAWKVVAPLTMMDVSRGWSLWSAVRQSMGPGALLDAGTYHGGSAMLMAMAAPNDTVHTFDSVKYKELDDRIEAAWSPVKVHQGYELPSDWTEPIRCAQIDVNKDQYTRRWFQQIWMNLVRGGIVVFEDYATVSLPEVTFFVNELAKDEDKIVATNFGTSAWVVKV